MKENDKFNTEGNEKADELAQMGSDLKHEKADELAQMGSDLKHVSSAKWLAGDMQEEKTR